MKMKILAILMIVMFLSLSCSYALDISQYQASYSFDPDRTDVKEVFIIKASANEEFTLPRGNAWNVSLDSSRLEWQLVRDNNANLIRVRFPYTGTYSFTLEYLRSDFLSSPNSLSTFQSTLPEINTTSTSTIMFYVPSDYQFGFTNPASSPVKNGDGGYSISYDLSQKTPVYVQYANFTNLTLQRISVTDNLSKQYQNTLDQLNGVLGLVRIFNSNYTPYSLSVATATNEEAKKHLDSIAGNNTNYSKIDYEEAGISESLYTKAVNDINIALNETYMELGKYFLIILLIILLVGVILYYRFKRVRKGSDDKNLPQNNPDSPTEEPQEIETHDEDLKPSRVLFSLKERMQENIENLNQLSRDIERFGFTSVKETRKTEKKYKSILYNILEPLDNCQKYLNYLKMHKENLKNENKLTDELESEINNEIERLEAIENNLEIVLKHENVRPSTSIGDFYSKDLHNVDGGGIKPGARVKEILEQGYVHDDDVLRLAIVRLEDGG